MSRAPFQSPLSVSSSSPALADGFSLAPPSSPLARQTAEPPGAPKKSAPELENNGWRPASPSDRNPVHDETYWRQHAKDANLISSPASMAIFHDDEYKADHQCKHCQRFYREYDIYRAEDVGNTCICCLVAVAYPDEDQQQELLRQSGGDMLRVLSDIGAARACIVDYYWKTLDHPSRIDQWDFHTDDSFGEEEDGELPCGCIDVCRGRCGDYAGGWSFNRGY